MGVVLRRLWEHQLVEPRALRSSREDFEVVGVFNPGVVQTLGGVQLMLRVAERPRERRPDQIGLPRWEEGELRIDWTATEHLERLDPRVVRLKDTGEIRLTFVSHLRIATSSDGRQLDGRGAAERSRGPDG